MRLGWIVVGSVLGGVSGVAHAQRTTAFDGNWQAMIYCEPFKEGGEYTLRFPANVIGGLLHGEHGKRGEADSLTLDGEIQPDGSAVIHAQGMTGPTRYNVGRTAEGVPYHYTLQSRFEGMRGTGRRTETRPCTASFNKQ